MDRPLADQISSADVLAVLEQRRTFDPSMRVHPLGFLQIPFDQNASRTTETPRINIWSNEIAAQHGDPNKIHAHDCELRSLVLAGSIEDREILVYDDPTGEHTTTITAYEGGRHVQRESGRRVGFQEVSQTVHPAGAEYRVPRGAFHFSSLPDGFAVTVIHKYDFRTDEPAEVLVEAGRSTDFGFDHSLDVARFSAELIERAIEALKL